MIKSNIKKTLNVSNLSIQSLFIRLWFLGFVGMWACKTNDPIATPMPNTDYSIIDGDTVKTVVFKDYKKLKDFDPNGKNFIVVGDTIVTYKEPKLHTPPAKDPDLSKLKNNDDPELMGKPLRMIAIGGSLTAGVRDGGYFNEGILTSYPNLIARQMKLKKFEQPLFDPSDFNGFGRKVPTSFNPTGGPVPKFNEVKNNGGVESVNEKGVKLKKDFKQNDNIGIVNGTAQGILLGWGFLTESDARWNESKYKFFSRMVPFYYRMNDYIKYNGPSDYISKTKVDIVTYEGGMQDVLDYLINGNSIFVPDIKLNVPGTPKTRIVEEDIAAYVGKSKLCMATVPDVFDFPYFNIVNSKKVIDAFNQFAENNLLPSDEYFCAPSSSIDSLLSPKVHISFKSDMIKKNKVRGIVSKTEFSKNNFIINTNVNIKDLSKKYKFAVVDLYNIYKKIHSGNYVTDDGIKVDPTYLKGNFYSSDGIYPTPFGNAVIANEFIKSINEYYGSEIPLIPTRAYLTIK